MPAHLPFRVVVSNGWMNIFVTSAMIVSLPGSKMRQSFREGSMFVREMSDEFPFKLYTLAERYLLWLVGF